MPRPESSTHSTAAVIAYVERRRPEALPQLLEGLGRRLGVPPEQVRHELCGGRRWVQSSVVTEMFRRCREDIFGDPMVVYRMAFEAIVLHRWDPLRSAFLRWITTPRFLAMAGPWLMKRFTRTLEHFAVEDYTEGGCRVVVRFKPHLNLSHDSCLFLQGGLAAVPLRLGDPAVTVHETACMFKGDHFTVYEMSWEPFSIQNRARNIWQIRPSQREEFLLGTLDRQVRHLDRLDRELQRTSASYRAMMLSAPDPILVVMPDGGLEALNDLGARLLERPGGQPQHLSEVVHPDDLETVASQHRMLLTSGQEATKMVFRLAGPEERLVEASCSRVEEPERGAAMLAILRDVTERREMDRRLAEQNRRFESLVENSPLAMAFVDSRGRYRYVNQRFGQLFGYTLEQVKCGRDWLDLAFPDPEQRARALKTWRQDRDRVAQGRQVARVFPVTCADGSIRQVKFYGVGLDGGECLIQYVDVSDTVQAETALQRREAELRAIVDGSPEGIVLLDRRGRVVQANPRAAAMFGSEDNPRGRLLWELTPAVYGPWIQDLWTRLWEEGSLDEEIDLPLNGEEDEATPCELKGVVLGPDEVYLGLTDIRARRRLERQRQEAARLAGVVELAGTAAHELNQPLTSLLAATEMMGHYEDTDNLKRLGAMAGQDAQTLAELVARFGRIVRYETKEYLRGTRIIDLERAASRPEQDEADREEVPPQAAQKSPRNG